MPGVLVVFFALQGLVGALTLKDEVGAALRPEAQYGEQVRPGFTAWTYPRWVGTSEGGTSARPGTCSFMVFVTIQGDHPLRVRIGGREENLSMGYSREFTVFEGNEATIPVAVLHPVGGALVGTKDLRVWCVAPRGSTEIRSAW